MLGKVIGELRKAASRHAKPCATGSSSESYVGGHDLQSAPGNWRRGLIVLTTARAGCPNRRAYTVK